MKKFFVFALAAMSLSVVSCKKDGANANAENAGEKTEAVADGMGSAAQAKGDLPYEASKVLADAQNLIAYSTLFDGSCEVSYKALKDGELNGVAFRCAHADKSIDYVIMTYNKDGEIEEAIGTDKDLGIKKVGYNKKCVVLFSGSEEDPTYELKEAAQEIDITYSNDWFVSSSLTGKELSQDEMKAYYEEHKDITWLDENTEWSKF